MPVTKLVDAFANAADPGTINAIPETTATPGAASFSKGFPAVTMEAPAAGGIPPFGQDFNGILNQVTAILAQLNAGELFVYDGTFAAAIGGYGLGALVAMANGQGVWLNLSAGNTTNPDTGGANWVPVVNYGGTFITTTGGSTTLTSAQYRNKYIFVGGALTSNANLVLPAFYADHIVANLCTGGFTLSVSAAGGSTSVTIPAGGAGSPTGVYFDGANIQPSTAPLAVPIDQAATPLTLAERTSAGYILATYFNQSSAIEAPSPGAVFVENAGHDGFLRKISLANFISALGLATVAFVNSLPKVKAGNFNCANGVVPVTFATPFAAGPLPEVVVTWNYANPDVGTIVAGSITLSGFSYQNGNAGRCNYVAVQGT